MNFYNELDVVDAMERAKEVVSRMNGKHEIGKAAEVRKAIMAVMKELRLFTQVDEVRRDNVFWQVDFSGTMDAETRQVTAELAAEQLGIKPEEIKLVGLYPKS